MGQGQLLVEAHEREGPALLVPAVLAGLLVGEHHPRQLALRPDLHGDRGWRVVVVLPVEGEDQPWLGGSTST